jgi:hypothetical protein
MQVGWPRTKLAFQMTSHKCAFSKTPLINRVNFRKRMTKEAKDPIQ